MEIGSDESIKFQKLLEKHSNTSHISYFDYVIKRRKDVFAKIGDRKVVYLDTNAWKCVSDFLRGKESLTHDMVEFSREMLRDDTSKKFVFPVTASTIFELQSMNDEATIMGLAEILDKFSDNICIVPDVDRIEIEINAFLKQEALGVGSSFYCSAFELLHPISQSLPFPDVPQFRKFLKAAYDLMAETNISDFILDPDLRGNDSEKWDNNLGIQEMNTGKKENEYSIKKIQDAFFVELSGIFEGRYYGPSKINGLRPAKWLATEAMLHWRDQPTSTFLITARIMANIHTVMRFEKNRVFKKGDVADFSTAASVLPVCDAFFTDARLVNIAASLRVRIADFCRCKLICGFDKFSDYLKEN